MGQFDAKDGLTVLTTVGLTRTNGAPLRSFVNCAAAVEAEGWRGSRALADRIRRLGTSADGDLQPGPGAGFRAMLAVAVEGLMAEGLHAHEIGELAERVALGPVHRAPHGIS